MKVLLVGGGSGGHITPPLAVARELKQLEPKLEIHYAIEKGGKFLRLPQEDKNIDAVHTVFAGKFRRYHGESFVQHLKDIPTILKNIRDLFVFIMGIFQCLILVRRINPSAVFIKGGFVGVPVGIACAFWRIPFFTHDSDTVPGLANRLIGRWARFHAVGMPAEFYTYPREKTRYVGIPIAKEFVPVSKDLQAQYRESLDLAKNAPVVCVTGGSLGAVRLNTSVAKVLSVLIRSFPDLQVLHQTGQTGSGLYADADESVKNHVREFAHVSDLYRYTGAADVVIARAGATTIAELARQEVPSIMVPAPHLTGGQQPKNAKHLEKTNAALVVTEAQSSDVSYFAEQIRTLLKSTHQQQVLKSNIARLARPDAAKSIATALLELVHEGQAKA